MSAQRGEHSLAVADGEKKDEHHQDETGDRAKKPPLSSPCHAGDP